MRKLSLGTGLVMIPEWLARMVEREIEAEGSAPFVVMAEGATPNQQVKMLEAIARYEEARAGRNS